MRVLQVYDDLNPYKHASSVTCILRLGQASNNWAHVDYWITGDWLRMRWALAVCSFFFEKEQKVEVQVIRTCTRKSCL